MKKFLLLSALAMGAFAAQADTYSDYYKVTDVEGKELQNGETLYCTHFDDNTNLDGMNMGYTYETVLVYPNVSGDNLYLYSELGCVDRPTLEDFNAHKWDYVEGTFYTVNGTPNACYSANIGGMGSCVLNSPGEARVIEVSAGNETFNWQVHCPMIDPASVVKYTFTTKVCTGDDINTAMDDTACTINIVFGPSMEAINSVFGGVNDITVDDEAPVYFNLNGVQVNNPTKGIYVVKRGSKVTKEVIR